MCRRFTILALLFAGFSLADCRFYFLDQYDFNNNAGFLLDLETTSNGVTPCTLSALNLVMGVGDGSTFHWIVTSPKWQTGHMYELTATVTPAGFQLTLDGQTLGSAQGGFKPVNQPVVASEIPSWASAPAAFRVNQADLHLSDGISDLSLSSGSSSPLPVPLQLMASPAAWQGAFPAQNQQPTSITVHFQIDSMATNPHQFDPYVDRYGQTTYSDWASKAHSDDDLTAAKAVERSWLDSHQPVAGLDPYGGSTTAGWTANATGFYYPFFNGTRWWLITPLGNPCFYISISDAIHVWQYTPVTGRESMFAELPPNVDPYSFAWGRNVWSEGGNTLYFSFQVANLIRKYGADWSPLSDALLLERAAKWGFAGVGKWSPRYANTPVMPVLSHSSVPNLSRHPDVFNPGIVAQLSNTFASQITADLINPFIVGWSIGNEYDEIITPDEITAILNLGSGTSAKRAFVDRALSSIYGGNVAALAQAWKITAASATDVYATKPTPPAADIETLRQFYANTYYQTLVQTLKTIDPNHLFLGFWITPNWWVNSTDWTMQAAVSDVIGFDYYVGSFLEPYLDALIQGSGKPVMVGEFSFPPGYGGWRGFDTAQYPANVTLSDSLSGDKYAQWLQATSAYPNVVGVSWFEYRDEPITGRGPGSGSSLVIGEHDAFGLVDVTDQPKFDLVEKVLSANVAALTSLGLVQPAAAAPSGNAAKK